MLSHAANHTIQPTGVRRPGWLAAAAAAGAPAVMGLVWLMASATAIVGSVIAVAAAVAWCVWLEGHV
jgi:hypothetical protein